MTDITKCPDYPAFQQLARALWHSGGGRGAAVLVGAGLSRTARTSGGNALLPPLWGDLAWAMAERLYPGETNRAPTDPLRLAEEFRTYFGQAALDELLRSMIDDAAWFPSQVHHNLMALPWSDVLTTNYDTLLERAARVAEREYQPVVSEANLAHAKAPRVVKLHGSMGASENFVIAEEDYRTYPANHAAFVNLARQIFVENELVLIGFSGDDPNFASWTGWVRDHLGSSARRIYLAGALNLSPAKRKFLEARNISPIDLHDLVYNVDETLRHQRAVELLLAGLAAAAPVLPHEWAPVQISGPQRAIDGNAVSGAARLQSQVEAWREDRRRYPGWVVCPGALREVLRHSTAEAHLTEPVLAAMEPAQAAAAIVELCWRHRTALWPMHPTTAPLVERFGLDAPGTGLGLSDRLTVATMLAWQFRFDGNHEGFERMAVVVAGLSPAPSDAAAEIAYLRAQTACLHMSYEEAVAIAAGIAGDDPFWGVRRAAVLAEAGVQSEAEAAVKTALAELRERRLTDRTSIWIASRLAWTEMMARAYDQSRFKRVPWSDRHRTIRSDPFEEVSRLRDKMFERRREEPTQGRVPGFAPGSYTDHSRTLRFRSWSNIDPSVELDLMLADGGTPPRVEHVSLFAAERAEMPTSSEHPTADEILGSLRFLDASEKSVGRYLSRLRIARLRAEVAHDVVHRLEAATAYWIDRVKHAREHWQLADKRMGLSLQALARFATRLDADEAVRLYRVALEWLRLFPGPLRSDLFREVLINLWDAIHPGRRAELVPETLDLPLAVEHRGVEPMAWLSGEPAVAAVEDPRRTAWVHNWTEAVLNPEFRSSAVQRLLYLVKASGLDSSELVAFEEALWTLQDDFIPPLPAGTNIMISPWADLPRPDGLDPKDATRERLFAPSEEIPDWQLVDIRRAIDTNRLRPTPTQAAELFDHLVREVPPEVGSDPASQLRANLSGYDRTYRERLVSATLASVGAVLDDADRTDTRADALGDFVSRTGAISALSALARWPASPSRLAAIATTAKRDLRSSNDDRVSDTVELLIRWVDGLEGSPPAELLELAEAVVSAIEYRRSHSVWHLLRALRRLVDNEVTSKAQNDRIASTLSELIVEWDYASISLHSEEAGIVSLVRAECVRVARALRDFGWTGCGITEWMDAATEDPLPEVRSALFDQDDPTNGPEEPEADEAA
jgi:hypothetical protein